jgi:NAD-dependent dihydropyrimidine dehydrogenase PreA subunit
MPFVITASCLDTCDAACTKVCPVDCIYEGERTRYINPNECIDCGACEPACPVQAIYMDYDVPAEMNEFIADNASFFNSILAGRTAPLGKPGSAMKVGKIGVDTPYVANYVVKEAG